MTLPEEFTKVLSKILSTSAITLEKKLEELISAQNSFRINQDIFLLPQEIINNISYFLGNEHISNSNFNNSILNLLEEWQSINYFKKIEHLQAHLDHGDIPSNFSRNISDRIINNYRKHRLLVLTAPFKISTSCIAELRENLEIELVEDLKMFFANNYPFDSKTCPVEFHGDYFYKPITNEDIHQLQSLFNHIPTLILFNSISDYKAYFHLCFWLPYSQHVLRYTLPTWYWEEACEALTSDDKPSKKSVRIIRQTIISILEILATFISDWYYLNLNANYSPKIFENHIFSSIYLDASFIQPYINILEQTRTRRIIANEKLLSGFIDWKINTNKQLKQKIKEWYLCGLLNSHPGVVYSLAFNSDRSILMSGGSDGSVRLWHPNTGKLSLSLKGHIGDVFSVAISNNDCYFASSGSDCKVLVWRLDKIQEPTPLTEHTAYVSSLTFCPDNRLLASGSYDKTIRIWDLWTGKPFRVFTEHTSYITSLAFNYNGELLASGSYDKTIRIWNPLDTKSKLTLVGHDGYVNCVAFSPCENILASGGHDGVICLWRAETGTLLKKFKRHNGGVNSLAFSSHGEMLVSGSSDRTVRVWNVRTGEELSILAVGVHPILCVHFSKDGKQLVIGSSWTDNIKIWNCA
ncbi:MAG: WD40 repeat domain-containing protein [Pseudanabaenaceae cyanobacterium bins.39]|nr:WD40 repeat domain-containing protein [Pseudanabaenaceae cyanobacterium bins.39]